MLLEITWICAVATVAFALVPFLMTVRLRRYVRREQLRKRGEPYLPKTVLIVPCKGTDLHFEDNISGFLSFSHPDYQVFFVTATSDDPARAEIERIVAQHPHGGRARLLVAGIEGGRAQKMTNLLKGVESAGDDVEVFAFMDADMRTHPGLLEALIEPLQWPAIGATTGFPVFSPRIVGVGSLLKSLWGFGGLLMMADRERNFTHGAVNAIRRETFVRAKVGERLRTTTSDSMTITASVRGVGLGIYFVPQALTVADDQSSVSEIVRWTNRQTMFTRVYNRPFWWTVALSYCFSNLMILAGLSLAAAVAFGADVHLLAPASILTGLMLLQIGHAIATFPHLLGMLSAYPEQQRILAAVKWRLCLLAPAASLLILINSLNSLTTNVITWRGIRYRLVSSSRTEVIGGV